MIDLSWILGGVILVIGTSFSSPRSNSVYVNVNHLTLIVPGQADCVDTS